MIKKIGSFLLVAVMLMAMLTPFTAMAAQSGQCGDNLIWVLDDSGTLTIAGTGDMWNWEIGSEAPWYSYPSSIKNVVINYGVTSIGNWAFAFCDNLTTISIPGSVTSIGEDAFNFCESLTTISIPGSVTSIGGRAFVACDSLTSISIPGSVTSIGYYAFSGCESLASISIPNSVTSIGVGAFGFCDSLVAIFVDENNPNYRDINGVLYSKDRKTLFCYPAGKRETYYTIPDGVIRIWHCAFNGCESLASISIPNNVTSIGDRAFNSCESLATIIIPSSVTTIGVEAFSWCKSLTTISIPGSVTSIGEYAFCDCTSLTSISIPGSVTSIGKNAFSDCTSLTEIYYEGSETKWNVIAKDAKVPENTKVHYGNNYSVAPGTVIGSALRTDIKAEINGHAIPSFNVDGYTYIVAEDLKDYGFSVYYDNSTRTLAINRDNSKTDVTRNYVKPYVPKSEVGIKEHDLVATDIVTYLDNNYAKSYNINGLTIIPFNDLGRYGAVYYDDSSRTIRATIPGLN